MLDVPTSWAQQQDNAAPSNIQLTTQQVIFKHLAQHSLTDASMLVDYGLSMVSVMMRRTFSMTFIMKLSLRMTALFVLTKIETVRPMMTMTLVLIHSYMMMILVVKPPLMTRCMANVLLKNCYP